MAPNQSRKSKAAIVSSDVEDIQEPAQSESVFVRAEKLIASNKKRRDSQRKVIVAEREQRVKATKAKINTLFGDRKTRVTKSQRALWERLDDLNKRRQDLEGQILASMKSIEIQTGNISSELEAVFAARIKDIEDPDVDEVN